VLKLASALSRRVGRDRWKGARGAGVETLPEVSPNRRIVAPAADKAQASLRSPPAGGVPVRRRGEPGDEGGRFGDDPLRDGPVGLRDSTSWASGYRTIRVREPGVEYSTATRPPATPGRFPSPSPARPEDGM
jgi:hypothetical protein